MCGYVPICKGPFEQSFDIGNQTIYSRYQGHWVWATPEGVKPYIAPEDILVSLDIEWEDCTIVPDQNWRLSHRDAPIILPPLYYQIQKIHITGTIPNPVVVGDSAPYFTLPKDNPDAPNT